MKIAAAIFLDSSGFGGTAGLEEQRLTTTWPLGLIDRDDMKGNGSVAELVRDFAEKFGKGLPIIEHWCDNRDMAASFAVVETSSTFCVWSGWRERNLSV